VEDGSRPIGIASNCNRCHAAYNAARHVAKTTPDMIKLRRDEEFFVLHHKLDALPFRVWLEQRVKEIGLGNVAAAIGVSSRRVSTIIEGREYNSKMQKSYRINYVQLQTVDAFAVALGYTWADIYPELQNFNRVVVRNRLWKKGHRLRKKPYVAPPPLDPIDPISDYKRRKKARRDRRR